MTGCDPLDLIDLYRVTTGRLIFASRRTREAAEKLRLKELVEELDDNIAAGREVLRLERVFAGRPRRAQHAPGAVAADAQVDRALTAFDSALNSKVELFGAESPEGVAATKVRKAVFPLGVGAVTSKVFIEEHEAVGSILDMLAKAPDDPEDKTGELAPEIELLGLQRDVAQLGVHNQEYGAKLNLIDGKVPAYADVFAAQTDGQRRLAEVVSYILGKYRKMGDEDVAARRALLGPILRQNEAIAQHRRNRRRPLDVDPDTGEEIEPDFPPEDEGA